MKEVEEVFDANSITIARRSLRVVHSRRSISECEKFALARNCRNERANGCKSINFDAHLPPKRHQAVPTRGCSYRYDLTPNGRIRARRS